MTIRLAKILPEPLNTHNKRITTRGIELHQGDCCFILEEYDNRDRSKAFLRTDQAMYRCRVHWDYDQKPPTEATIVILEKETSRVITKVMDNRISEWLTGDQDAS